MRCSRCLLWFVLFVFAFPAIADERDVAEARQRFVEGTELVKRAQWSEALAAFERSAKLRPHATTVFNIGACERALGHYAEARATFRRAMAMKDDDGGKLPERLLGEAQGFVDEISRLLAHVVVTVDPTDAAIAVDGRPLEMVDAAAAPPRVVAGTLAPSAGTSLGAPSFEMEIDPGTHIMTLSRRGFSDVVVNRTFAPASRTPLRLALERLPATLHIASVAGAAVTVDGVDVGVAPIDLSRPPGRYRVAVQKLGYAPYRELVLVQAGQELQLQATLQRAHIPIYKRWWFWTAGAAIVASVAVGAYLIATLTRTPQLDGGGLQWVAKAQESVDHLG